MGKMQILSKIKQKKIAPFSILFCLAVYLGSPYYQHCLYYTWDNTSVRQFPKQKLPNLYCLQRIQLVKHHMKLQARYTALKNKVFPKWHSASWHKKNMQISFPSGETGDKWNGVVGVELKTSSSSVQMRERTGKVVKEKISCFLFILKKNIPFTVCSSEN